MKAIRNFFSMVFGLVFWVVVLGAAWKYVGVPYFKTIDPTTAQVIQLKVVGQDGSEYTLERVDTGERFQESFTENDLRRLGYYQTSLYVFKESDNHAAICGTASPEQIDYTTHCSRFNHKI